MNRLLLLLLALLLPLQFSWALLGPYCGDEHEGATTHALHAEPGDQYHHAQLQVDDADDPGASLDCSHCHGHLTPLPPAEAQAPQVRLSMPWLEDGSAATPARAGPRPERPQWTALA
ncbi:cobalt-zinc-cadmium resistance protein [Inhella proteolytica]|uniref:Cobalt-zinc-cadmium resistance protein n=1 Tax=Inhella proteolytica TaxID=2795029 RepID=A0A931NFY4_9BURK|nr:cobalt-zinc-cadmium resistance protein [Inhella proteolytica]MBH9576586.1 cobalt-zinc-cadmium resistance protein [Inhella proteolytica]